MLALIDSDSIACAAGHAEEIGHACHNFKMKMLGILHATGCNDYRAIFSSIKDETNFRKLYYPEYKINRKGKERPKYEHEAREYGILHWDVEVVSGIEADDAVVMAAAELDKDEDYSWVNPDINELLKIGIIPDADRFKFVLCHLDKDVDQKSGLHYDYFHKRKDEDRWYYISPLEGLRNFYTQILTGDSSDNIPRCVEKGWGAKAEHKIVKERLKNAQTEQEMYTTLLNECVKKNKGDREKAEKEIEFLGNLLYLKRHLEDTYRIPV